MPPKKAVRKKERRRMARADAQLSMRVDGGLGDSGVTPIVTESRNISASGVYCFSPHYLPPLSKTDSPSCCPVPGADAGSGCKCEAIVVRAGGEGEEEQGLQLACGFLDLHSDTRAMLDEYVVAQPPGPARRRPRDGPARADHDRITARTTARSALRTTRRTRRAAPPGTLPPPPRRGRHGDQRLEAPNRH
jgi:hypothetical protein